MAMSKRSGGEKQEDIWIAHTELAVAPGHPFYKRLNELLEGAGFDEFVEGLCARFYHARLGRPSLMPGVHFRALLIGYFEGIDSERGIAWRLADSLALRRFLRIGLDERTPDHSTISRTRRLMDIDTHREVFSWVLGLVAERGLLKGQRMGIDATTLEANAAMRSIVRRDTPHLTPEKSQRTAQPLLLLPPSPSKHRAGLKAKYDPPFFLSASNSYDCGDPKESTVPTRVAQRSRASLSEGESREVPVDS
jgi:transposase